MHNSLYVFFFLQLAANLLQHFQVGDGRNQLTSKHQGKGTVFNDHIMQHTGHIEQSIQTLNNAHSCFP